MGGIFQNKQLKEEKVFGATVYTALLRKGNEQLHTAWWYDNGKYHTTSQLEWRWKQAFGANAFTLVNITAATRSELEAGLEHIYEQNPFQHLLAKQTAGLN